MWLVLNCSFAQNTPFFFHLQRSHVLVLAGHAANSLLCTAQDGAVLTQQQQACNNISEQ